MRYIMSYDLGTGGVKSCLYDESGALICHAMEEYATVYPFPGYQEQNPKHWWEAVVRTTRRLLEESGVDAQSIEAIGISGHSLGVVAVDGTGRALVDATPIWSDTRAIAQARRFFERVDEKAWYLATGNGFPAHLYALFKMMWIHDEMPELYGKTARFLGSKDYINARLTGALFTDPSYASGSGVYDLIKRRYVDEWCESAGIDHNKFPDIVPSTQVIGRLTDTAAAELNLTTRTRVVAGGVDNALIALGANCFTEGRSYLSLGSSAWVAVSSEHPVVDWAKKPYVFEHAIPGQYVSATCIFSAGSSLKWVKDELCRAQIGEAEKRGADVYDLLTEMAERSPAGANQLLFNPSLAGGSSLEHTPEIRGAFLGLDLRHTQSDIIRATLEGIALNLRVALDALKSHTHIRDLLIVGGGSKSKLWRQIFADVFEMNTLITPVGQDAGALGAAALAALGSGLWKDVEPIGQAHSNVDITRPNEKNARIYRALLPLFEQAGDFLSELCAKLSTCSRYSCP